MHKNMFYFKTKQQPCLVNIRNEPYRRGTRLSCLGLLWNRRNGEIEENAFLLGVYLLAQLMVSKLENAVDCSILMLEL